MANSNPKAVPFTETHYGWLTVGFAALSVLLLIYFRQAAWLDMAFARFYFDASLCDTPYPPCAPFLGHADPFLTFVQENGLKALRIFGGVMLIGSLALFVFYGWSVLNRLWRVQVLASTLSLLIGPIVLTNFILKAYWGRPRPRALEEFGGEHPFVLPGTITDYCQSNCSFVSGEASGAIWLLTFIPLIALLFRPSVAWVLNVFLTVVALGVAYNRVVFGAHFLSDVVLAATFTLTIVFACHWLLHPRLPR